METTASNKYITYENIDTITDSIADKISGIEGADTATDDDINQIAEKIKQGTTTLDPDYVAYTHPDSGVTPGTYMSVTVDKQGHVTYGENPTDLTLKTLTVTDALTIPGGKIWMA